MKKIYLHIGQHKTGTTAIQNFLQENRGLLLEKGYLYPKTGFYINAQHQLAWAVKNVAPNWVLRKHPEFKDIVSSARELYGQLCEEISDSGCSNIIISSEQILFGTELDLLRDLLAGFHINIIIYLRRQDYLVQSLYTQAMKDPGVRVTESALEYYESDKIKFDPYQTVMKWSDVFGKENITIRPYEKQQLSNENLILDFMDICGLTGCTSFNVAGKNPNRRLHPVLIEFLRNLYSSSLKNDQLDLLVPQIIDFNEQVENSDLFSDFELLSTSERSKIIKDFEKSNKKIAIEFLGRDDGKLFYEPLPNFHERERKEGTKVPDVFFDLIIELLSNQCPKNRQFEVKLIKDSSEQIQTATGRRESPTTNKNSKILLDNIYYGNELIKLQPSAEQLFTQLARYLGLDFGLSTDELSNIISFVSDFSRNRKSGVFGGPVLPGDELFIMTFMQMLRPKRMLEIGVASGVSSAFILSVAEELDLLNSRFLLSLDLDGRPEVGSYCRNNHSNLCDSWELKRGKTSMDLSEYKCDFDLIFVDGGHAHPWPLVDLVNLSACCRKSTWVLMQDVRMQERWLADSIIHGVPCPRPVRGVDLAVSYWPGTKFLGTHMHYNMSAVKLDATYEQIIKYIDTMLVHQFEIETFESISSLRKQLVSSLPTSDARQ